MKNLLCFYSEDETKLLELGQSFSVILRNYLEEDQQRSFVIYLSGELGAGKTTFTRSILRGFGYQGNVKSPTYTLVEEYSLPSINIYHFDLYRLADPEELEFMGIRDYFRPQTLCLLEWADKGNGMIPEADFIIQLDYSEKNGRNITFYAKNTLAEAILAKFKSAFST